MPATWSPEPLLIGPIKGGTEPVQLRQDGTSSGLQVEDPSGADWHLDQFPFSKFSTIL